jgi:hypothetical protein
MPTVLHVQELPSLDPGARHLRIVGSELPDLLALEELPALEHLEIHGSRVGSLLGAGFCPRLERIDLLFTSIEDAGDLLGVGAWRTGTLVGNPWNAQSWSLLAAEARRSPLLLPLWDDLEWARRIWDVSGLCADFLADGTTLLVRPGLPSQTVHPFDAVLVPTDAIGDPPDGSQLERMARDAPFVAPDLDAWAAKLGTNAGARRWLATAGLDLEDREAFHALARRFPALGLVGASDPAYDEEERRLDQLYPGLDPELRPKLLATLPLGRLSPVRFDGLHDTYDLGLRAPSPPGYAVIGVSRAHPQSTLAVRLVAYRTPVYAFDVTQAPHAVFDSFQDMLAGVASPRV